MSSVVKDGITEWGKVLTAIDHVQITVPRNCETQARHFYCEILGLREIEKPENRRKNGGFWAQVGGVQLHVGLEDDVVRTKTKAHVAFRTENLAAWRKRIQDLQIEVLDSPPFPNATAFEFRDPFGNRVEIIQVD
jgi:catechol 2,3-dioxygenase-like lactoylglutathione lyase family enzyme